MRNIWKATKQQIERDQAVHFQSIRKGKPQKDQMHHDVERIKTLTVLERSTIRKMAWKLEIFKSLNGKWIKQKLLRPHTSATKPVLTNANKLGRLKFSLSQLRHDVSNDKFSYNSMHNIVHIDEKWFFITKTANRFYLLPREEDPYRSCKSKRFITKVMFMCVVSRPLIGHDGTVEFDGKIGIFPFTEQVAAKRSFKNRVRGTMETKPIHAVTKSVIKDCIINQVIPAIKSKWQISANKEILIQQDNAKPHINRHDSDFIQVATSDGFNMKLISQPSNSPDTNVNDLGFFRAIQSLQDGNAAKNVDDLMNNVSTLFEELSAVSLNNVFVTLQSCFTKMMKVKGGNDYKIPYMNKNRLIRMGVLPECIEVKKSLVEECIAYVMQLENDAGSGYDLGPLMHAFGYHI